jgi:ABC-type Fe3+ transport system substrate-binding protein
MAGVYAPVITYSSSFVPPDAIKSYYDLLDPHWKGKLAMEDPRSAGAGLGLIHFAYTSEALGKEYIRQLFTQNITLSRDGRQLSDWVARGQYALQLAGSVPIVMDMRARGINIDFRGPDDLKEGGWIATGPTALALPNRAPHPNAARVYIDYLLSAEGQEAFSRGVGYASRRVDVPADHILPSLRPKPGTRHEITSNEVHQEAREESAEFVRSVIGS